MDKICKIYAYLIKKDLKTIDEVPENMRDKVVDILSKMKVSD